MCVQGCVRERDFVPGHAESFICCRHRAHLTTHTHNSRAIIPADNNRAAANDQFMALSSKYQENLSLTDNPTHIDYFVQPTVQNTAVQQ